jgi:hypothetical protein
MAECASSGCIIVWYGKASQRQAVARRYTVPFDTTEMKESDLGSNVGRVLALIVSGRLVLACAMVSSALPTKGHIEDLQTM